MNNPHQQNLYVVVLFHNANVMYTQDSTPTLKRSEVFQMRKQEPPLPRPFELPNCFTGKVSAGIKEGVLRGTARTTFYRQICCCILTKKSYPSLEEYDHVAQRIIEKFPFMSNGKSDAYVSPACCLHQLVFIVYISCSDASHLIFRAEITTAKRLIKLAQLYLHNNYTYMCTNSLLVRISQLPLHLVL